MSQQLEKKIPVYRADGTLYGVLLLAKIEQLERMGLVRCRVEHKGHVNRVILHAGFARPIMRPPDGTRYSRREHVGHGKCYAFRPITHLASQDFNAVTVELSEWVRDDTRFDGPDLGFLQSDGRG